MRIKPLPKAKKPKTAKTSIKETDLYLPIKTLLQSQGYEVKGEIGKADIVGVRTENKSDDADQAEPVIVELKTAFSLSLFHQAIDRQGLTDNVYIAVPRGSGRAFLRALKNNKNLCRRLGLGLITVRLKDGFTEIHLDPAPYAPRKSKPKKSRLLREFAARVGDPNLGGADRRGKLITAYRQDALRCLAFLSDNGPTKASDVAKATHVEKARTIMAADHYGWFERAPTEQKGIYQITPNGQKAFKDYADAINELAVD